MPWLLLFWIFVAILPFSFALNPTTEIDLSLVRVFVPILFLVWLFSSFANKNLQIDKRLRLWLLGIFIFLTLISFFWAIEESRAIRKIIFLLSFVPLYFVSFSATQIKFDRLRLMKILTWSSVVVSLFALALFFLQFIIGIDSVLATILQYVTPLFLGNAFSSVVMAFPSWLVNIGGTTVLRTFGTFPDPHLFSLYINIVLPFAFYLFIKEKKRVYLLATAVLLISSLLAFSRAAYLSLLIGIIFLFLSSKPFLIIKKHPLHSLAIALLLFYLLALPNLFTQRLQTSIDTSEGSNQARIEMWGKGLETIKDHPLTGIGIGNFSRYVQPTSHFRDPIYAHNLFLDFGAEIGLFGTFVLFFLLLAPIAIFFTKPTSLRKFIATAFVIFIVHSLFETPFFSVRVFPLIIIFLSMHTDD